MLLEAPSVKLNLFFFHNNNIISESISKRKIKNYLVLEINVNACRQSFVDFTIDLILYCHVLECFETVNYIARRARANPVACAQNDARRLYAIACMPLPI